MKQRFTRLMQATGVADNGISGTGSSYQVAFQPPKKPAPGVDPDPVNPTDPADVGNLPEQLGKTEQLVGDLNNFSDTVKRDLSNEMSAQQQILKAKGLENDPGALSQASLIALGKVVGNSTMNLAKLKPGSPEATIAQQELQALVRFQQEIQALFMDLKILPFKLLSAFARGIGLTVLS